MNSTLLLLASLSIGQPDAAFERGVLLRADSKAAQAEFRIAAKGFDERWTAGDRSPALAQNRAKAHALAGQLPEAILAIHEGLAIAPSDIELQRDLETLRGTVDYPSGWRPNPPRGWRTRFSGWDQFFFACASLASIALAAILRGTVRSPWAWPFLAIGLLGLSFSGFAGWQLNRESEPLPRVVRWAAPIRKGNGESYPTRYERDLPRGAEVKELHRRGGWVQIELANGERGWVPGNVLLGE